MLWGGSCCLRSPDWRRLFLGTSACLAICCSLHGAEAVALTLSDQPSLSPVPQSLSTSPARGLARQFCASLAASPRFFPPFNFCLVSVSVPSRVSVVDARVPAQHRVFSCSCPGPWGREQWLSVGTLIVACEAGAGVAPLCGRECLLRQLGSDRAGS